ncbi:MAG TPA: NAD(P)(+) transhydrogenase (Re/Si-specific) subunit beta, partial [Sphingomonas sanguinis]|nr:NAD(P)(+) transhydrogenase (Re/Si-specific) subunit beta [Sphingomonas sanguinis]
MAPVAPAPLAPAVETVAANPWVSLAYLVAGVCFILALRGLSSPTTSQRGNRFGMIGMAIAVVTTLVTHLPAGEGAAPRMLPDMSTMGEILAAIGLG